MATETNETEKFQKDFYYETPNDELVGVETAIYANGNTVKRITLSDGKIAMVRELMGEEMMQIDDHISGENNPGLREKAYLKWIYHYAVKIDGKQIPMEDFGKLKGKDFNRIKISAQSLNF